MSLAHCVWYKSIKKAAFIYKKSVHWNTVLSSSPTICKLRWRWEQEALQCVCVFECVLNCCCCADWNINLICTGAPVAMLCMCMLSKCSCLENTSLCTCEVQQYEILTVYICFCCVHSKYAAAVNYCFSFKCSWKKKKNSMQSLKLKKPKKNPYHLKYFSIAGCLCV